MDPGFLRPLRFMPRPAPLLSVLPRFFTCDTDRTRVLVLGFYDRGNTGDEMYKVALPQLFRFVPGLTLTFKCMDDVNEPIQTEDYDMVLCGGGDIINEYFMRKACQLLRFYANQVYAVSVGMPYQADADFLRLFDHVFVRSRTEYEQVRAQIGGLNVTYMPDAAMVMGRVLPLNLPGSAAVRTFAPGARVNLGLCLAQPAFHDNPAGEGILGAVVSAVQGLMAPPLNLRITLHLLSFNVITNNDAESDVGLNARLEARCRVLGIPVVQPPLELGAQDVYQYMADQVDVVCGMRYHAVVFAVTQYKPVVALYSSSKVHRFVQDFAASIDGSLRMPVDSDDRPTSCDAQALQAKLRAAILQPTEKPVLDLAPAFRRVRNLIFRMRTYATVLDRGMPPDALHAVLAACKRALMVYLTLPSDAAYDALLTRRAPLVTPDPVTLSRIICFCVTRKASSSFMWGLASNMLLEDFCLAEAIQYIWEESGRVCAQQQQNGEVYYPAFAASQRRVFVNIDRAFLDDFKGMHRSGWSYVVGGMMPMCSWQFLRSETTILLDTYVDRTFHWGREILNLTGGLPYRRPWLGIVHHTYNETHSSYNCKVLFETPEFLASLDTCAGLIAMTQYLATGLRASLLACNKAAVPVHVLYHPMETVAQTFQLDLFYGNAQRKVVQIGAWLRDPYAIYELPLAPWNPVSLRKAVLKGREMDLYFPPPDLIEDLEAVLLAPQVAPGVQQLPAGCRPTAGSEVPCRPGPNTTNKFCAGLLDAVKRSVDSVQVLEHLNDAAYDALLSRNIVFLKLVDCSAVNTVLECMVRNTPIIVNRHPALEEVLGSAYPGFYIDLHHAAALMEDASHIEAMHRYLARMNKDKILLATFLEGLQDIVEALPTQLQR